MLKILKFIIVCLVTISSAFAQNSHSNDDIQSRVDKDYAYLGQLYKHLHSNPEISLQEKKTANIVDLVFFMIRTFFRFFISVLTCYFLFIGTR